MIGLSVFRTAGIGIKKFAGALIGFTALARVAVTLLKVMR